MTARTIFVQSSTPSDAFERAAGIAAREVLGTAAHHGRTAGAVARALDGRAETALRAFERERNAYGDEAPTPRQERAESVSQRTVQADPAPDARPVAGAPFPAVRPTGNRPVGQGCKSPAGLIDSGRTERSPDARGLGRGTPAAGSVTKRDKARAQLRARESQDGAARCVAARQAIARQAADALLRLEAAHAGASGAARREIRARIRALRHQAKLAGGLHRIG